MTDPSADWDWLEQELDALLAMDPEARELRLAELDASQPRAAGRLRSWLAGIQGAQSFLQKSPVPGFEAGQQFGPWCLKARIGEGGMGEVWLAERADGSFRRQVAIKFLRADRSHQADSLRRERELLARLRHPYIAALLDAGVTATGQPYLVTEWIDGWSLPEWIATGVDVRARVRLVAQLAEALVDAHANLIVHRDLKPANVRVARDGTPRLLDFGIARLLDAERGEAQTADRAMTPAFAAPEQVLGSAVTTRVDIHGLGGLLYWMLAGRPPFQLDEASLAEIVRTITQVDVPPLSRFTVVNPDLEAVVMKALAREPGLRYASVGAFAEDLSRWLAGDNVQARRPGWILRLWRWVRRYRLPVVLATGVLLAAGAGTWINLKSAEQARTARDLAEAERARAEAESRVAVTELARTEDLISLLASTFQDAGDAERLSANEWMDRIRGDVARLGPADPLARAFLMSKLAELEHDRGQVERAGVLLAAMVNDPVVLANDELAARTYCGLANARSFAGQFDEAERLLADGVQRAGKLVGASRNVLVHCLMLYGTLASRAGVAPHHRAALMRAETELARLPEREARWRRASLEYNLGMIDDIEGRFDDALLHYREAVRLDRELGHEGRASAAGTQATIAGILMLQGKLVEAEAAYAEALPTVEEVSGRSVTLAVELANHAGLLNRLGHAERALQDATRSLAIIAEAAPSDARTRANGLFEQGKAHLQLEHWAEARSSFAAAATAFASVQGAEHPSVLAVRVQDARAQAATGDVDGAVQQLDRWIQQLRQAGARTGLSAALKAKADLEVLRGDPARALVLLDEARSLHGPPVANEPLPEALVEVARAEVLATLGRSAEAHAIRTRILPVLTVALGDRHALVTRMAGLVGRADTSTPDSR